MSTAAGEREVGKRRYPLAFAAGLTEVVFCTLGVTAVELGVFGSSTLQCHSADIFRRYLYGHGITAARSRRAAVVGRASPKSGGSSQNSNEPYLLDATGRIIDNKRKRKRRDPCFARFCWADRRRLCHHLCHSV
jgi:hypothetical protein